MKDELFRRSIRESVTVHEQLAADPGPALQAAAAIVEGLRRGGKLLLFGNGGSAADAQHVAAELVNRLQRRRKALAAVALTTDTSVLTSIGNDESFDRVFARQIEALGGPGDIALGISTSGRSANVVDAIECAKARGLTTIALTGSDGGTLGRAAAIHVNVPCDVTARVQEAHRTLLHIICELVENELA